MSTACNKPVAPRNFRVTAEREVAQRANNGREQVPWDGRRGAGALLYSPRLKLLFDLVVGVATVGCDVSHWRVCGSKQKNPARGAMCAGTRSPHCS